jgi:hypothetical protein
MYKLIFVLCLISFIPACSNKSNSNHYKLEEEKLKLLIPDEFQHDCSFKENYKVFVILNIECPDCLDELKSWESILKKKKQSFCIYFILTGNNQSFINYLVKQERFKKNIFIDKDFKFMDLNYFLNATDRTIIIDSCDRIIAKGSILKSSKKLNKILDSL